MCLAVPGKILEILGDDPLQRRGRVNFGGVVKEVILTFVPDAGVGDYVIVHVGVAISRLDEAEARRVLEFLEDTEDVPETDPGAIGPSP